MNTESKWALVKRTYFPDVQENSLRLIVPSVFLILAYLVFQSTIEKFLNDIWIIGVQEKIQSLTLVFSISAALLLILIYYNVKSKKLSVKPYEIFIIFFYTKYRFFDDLWEFKPLGVLIKFADVIPFIIILPKILSLRNIYKGVSVSTDMTGIIDPDTPLNQSNPDDKLKRSEFATQLVQILTSTKPSEKALVIGINGTWGSGKTSIEYLINKALQENVKAKDSFYRINFNPWFYSEKQSITASFLNIVKAKIEPDEHIISQSIGKYSKSLIASTEGLFFNTQFYKEFSHEDSIDHELSLIKSQIKTLNKTLLIIIDDLDRLSGNELIEVLRLVRLVGDFPNTIYIILYDKEYITNAIHHHLNDHNSSLYIEKIIQVEYTIPENNFDNLRQILTNHMEAAVKMAIPEAKSFWELEDINDAIKIDGFPYFIKHIRDVKRFTNNFLLRYKIIYKHVNFKQFLLIELLRYRHPELINVIYNSRSIFLSQFAKDDGFTIPSPKPQLPFWDDVISNHNGREILLKIASYKNEKNSISEVPFFANYFTLTLLNNNIDEDEFNELLKNAIDQKSTDIYYKWLSNNREMLLYRFRNFDSIKTPEDFIKFTKAISLVLNKMIMNDRVSTTEEWSELPKIFINKYMKASTGPNVDQKNLYQSTYDYLFYDASAADSLKNVFRDKTNFLVKGDEITGSPLTAGWKEASNHSVDSLTSVFNPNQNSPEGKFFMFNAPFGQYRFDLDFAKPVVFLRDSKIVLRFYQREWAFYYKINMSKNNIYKEAYFRILSTGNPTLEKVSDNEFTVGLNPKLIGTGWSEFNINVDEMFNRSFASEGFKLESVLGIGVRGTLGFKSFELY